jgi:hypothetical protein
VIKAILFMFLRRNNEHLRNEADGEHSDWTPMKRGQSPKENGFLCDHNLRAGRKKMTS